MGHAEGGATTGAGNARIARGRCRSRLTINLMTTSALVAVALVWSLPSHAQTASPGTQAARLSYTIPAQPLSRALVEFSNATGMQLFFDANLLRGKNSPGTSGALTQAEALAQLLAGSGLTYRISGNTVTISDAANVDGGVAPADADATVLPTIVVDVGAGAQSTVGTNLITIDRQDIERRQPSDIQEIFAGQPGVSVGGAIGSTQKIFVNGIEETNLAVTVDGSRQNNKVFHHNGTYLLDPALLKAVTVQPTVAPADAGPAALAGSIGFETVDPADLLLPGRNFGGFVSGTWDTNSKTHTTGISAYGMIDGFEFLGYLNYSKGDNFTAGNGQSMPGTGVDLLSGLGKFAYESEGHRFEISHEQVRDDALRPYRANFYFHRGLEPELRRYTLNRQNTVFTYNTVSPIGWWDPKVVLAYSRTRVQTPYYHPGTGIPSDVDGVTSSYNGKVENRFGFDLGTVTAGFDFYSDKAELVFGTPPLATDERASNIGAYAQARLEPTDRLRVAFGGRVDHQWFTGVDGSRYSHAGISGNVSGEYDIVPDFLTIKGGAARVWGGIPLAENYILEPTWNYGANGPDPVTSVNLTGGLEARFGGLTVEGTIFRNDIRNGRFPAWTDANRSFDLDAWGWEIGAGYEWDAGFVRAKYANVYGNVDGSPADTDVGRYLATPIGEIIMVSAGYTFADWGLTVGGDAEFALKNDRTAQEHPFSAGYPKLPLPAYTVVNAFAEYTPPSYENLTFRVEARNIFNETYTSRASYGQDFDGTVPHLEPGRSFRFNARLKF